MQQRVLTAGGATYRNFAGRHRNLTQIAQGLHLQPLLGLVGALDQQCGGRDDVSGLQAIHERSARAKRDYTCWYLWVHRLKGVPSVAFSIRWANANHEYTDRNTIQTATDEFDRLAYLAIGRAPRRDVIPTGRGRCWRGILKPGDDRARFRLQCAHKQPASAGRHGAPARL